MAAAKQKTEKSADAFRSIGEAAAELDLQTHVLRYWEGKFPGQIKPIKRRDGRRFFRPEDMDALRAVQVLVHRRGLTLKGARNLLDEQGVDAVLDGKARLTAVTDEEIASAPSPARDLQMTVRDAFVAGDDPAPADAIPTGETGSVERLETVLAEMTDIKARLDAALTRQAA